MLRLEKEYILDNLKLKMTEGMFNDKELSYGSDYKYIPATSIASGFGINFLADVFCHTVQIVNICLVGHPDSKDFVLVDAGMPGSANKIISVTEELISLYSINTGTRN